jgi:hypothetical protein
MFQNFRREIGAEHELEVPPLQLRLSDPGVTASDAFAAQGLHETSEIIHEHQPLGRRDTAQCCELGSQRLA